MTEPLGMLLAMMQPPPEMEEEFHDWYDTEHIPERAACDGFLSAQRFVCVDGWPRYVAVYDLRHHGVLKEPSYCAVAGDRFSPWSKRILPRVHGQARLEGPQVYPGDARYGDKGAPARMVLLRFRGMDASAQQSIVDGLRTLCEGRPEVFQLRAWKSEYHDDLAFAAMIEGDGSLTVPALDMTLLGSNRRYLDMTNLYIPYWRRGALHGVFSRP